MPRGKTLSQPSEHLLRDSTDALLKEIYNHYDYIIIDSSPVLAADDTTSLAPKIDATLFVVRLSYTSARLTKKALELLYSRQVNVPGVILNFVDTSLPEYYYYQYSEYYNTPPAVGEGEGQPSPLRAAKSQDPFSPPNGRLRTQFGRDTLLCRVSLDRHPRVRESQTMGPGTSTAQSSISPITVS